MRNIFRPRFKIGRLLVMAIGAYIMRQLANRQAQQAGNRNTVVLPPDAVSESKRKNTGES